jgi:hypothetical protein
LFVCHPVLYSRAQKKKSCTVQPLCFVRILILFIFYRVKINDMFASKKYKMISEMQHQSQFCSISPVNLRSDCVEKFDLVNLKNMQLLPCCLLVVSFYSLE